MDIGIKKVIGSLVRELRHEKKLSQAELAGRSGVHINTIHLIEAGLNEPKFSTLLWIAKGMNIEEREFLIKLCDKYYS